MGAPLSMRSRPIPMLQTTSWQSSREPAGQADTVLFNKVTIKEAKQAVQMFGPAQAAVARAVVDSVASGVIDKSKANDLCIWWVCSSTGRRRTTRDLRLQLSGHQGVDCPGACRASPRSTRCSRSTRARAIRSRAAPRLIVQSRFSES